MLQVHAYRVYNIMQFEDTYNYQFIKHKKKKILIEQIKDYAENNENTTCAFNHGYYPGTAFRISSSYQPCISSVCTEGLGP